MAQNRSIHTEERRHFFRIHDSVNLSYRLINEQQTQKPIQSSASLLDNCSLTSALELIAEESAAIHDKLERIHSDFADYLKLLDIKINLIAQAVIGLSGHEVTENQARNANLSVSGLGFDSNENLKVGQFLEIKMLLVHSTIVITTYAKVIHCFKHVHAHDESYDYFVGVSFVNMKESDCDLLSKHVAKKQLQQIRQQKEKQHHAEQQQN
ncbi:MAG: PilZ domain-containing protein [Methylococcales bacterium]|nr:PilZ domain-containing protein [Methylococcales bacterium]